MMSHIHRQSRRLLTATALLFLLVPATQAQSVEAPELSIPRIPRISQGAEARQIIGLSDITITYHRPGVKGRTIWGGLLPYGKVWRVGANEPTLITFSDPVSIDGHALKAGTYRLVVIPSRSDWTVIFNSEIRNWGSVYDSTFDVLQLSLTPETGPFEEWMSFGFTDLTSTSTRVVLAWEKVRIGFTATFDTMEKLAASLGGWRVLNQAARYAMSEEGGEANALAWAEQSLKYERNGANTRTKAEILARRGQYAEAITLGEESVTLTRAQNPKADVSALEELIAQWRAHR